jgi:hypothetical protein
MLLRSSIYVYLFFFGANIYRAIFGYARMLFPSVELTNNKGAITWQRISLGAIAVGIMNTAIWEIGTSFFSAVFNAK